MTAVAMPTEPTAPSTELDRSPPVDPPSTTVTRRALWGGRIMSGVALLFLAFDASIKVLQLVPAEEGTSQLGWPASTVFSLGILQVVCWIAYAVPRTAVLGALLWTGYLGGAVATHVRVDSPLFSHVLFPIYVAVLLWGGLWLREPRVRSLLPLRGSQP